MLKAIWNRCTALGLVFVLLGLLGLLAGCYEGDQYNGSTAVCSDDGYVIVTQADGSTAAVLPMDDTMCPVYPVDEGRWHCEWQEVAE